MNREQQERDTLLNMPTQSEVRIAQLVLEDVLEYIKSSSERKIDQQLELYQKAIHILLKESLPNARYGNS